MITIRRLAAETAADDLIALRMAWAEEKGIAPDATFANRFREWLRAEAGHRVFWLAHDEDLPVGMVNLTIFYRMPFPDPDFPGAWGYLGNLFVLPSARGGGTGGRLVAACTSYADREGLARIVLSPSPASVPIYERAGFVGDSGLMIRA